MGHWSSGPLVLRVSDWPKYPHKVSLWHNTIFHMVRQMLYFQTSILPGLLVIILSAFKKNVN